MSGQLVRDIRRDVIEKIDVGSVSEGQTRDTTASVSEGHQKRCH